jgi:hypothetical protein
MTSKKRRRRRARIIVKRQARLTKERKEQWQATLHREGTTFFDWTIVRRLFNT